VLLTKLRLAPVRVQRIALSAVLSDALRIASWLQADLLHYDQRPIDLQEGIVDVETGRFHWRSFNTKARGCDPLPLVFGKSPDGGSDRNDVEGDERERMRKRSRCSAEVGKDLEPPMLDAGGDEFRRDSVVALARWIAEATGEQVLVFVPTRWMSRAWAEEAAFHARLDPASEALGILERHEPNRGRDLLAGCLRCGVGFHNADLPSALRRLVEDEFQSGAIRILFSTPTLAQGVNLAGRNVIQVPHMVGEDPSTGQAAVMHLTRERFRNQGGRAARTGRVRETGRSMVLAAGEAEVERLQRFLIEGDLEEIRPPLEGADLAPALLDLLVSGVARSSRDLTAFLLETYTGQTVWAGEADVRGRIADALERLEKARLIRVLDAGDRIEVGGLAEAVAAAGIVPETACLLIDWLDAGSSPGAGGYEMQAILAAALAREMRPVCPPLTGREHSEPVVFEEVHHRLAPDRSAGGRFLWERVARPTGFTMDDRRTAKLALLLHDWIGPEETEAIETRYGVLSGSISAAGAQAAWILRAGGSLAAARGLRDVPETLRRLAERVEPGVGDEGIELACLRVEGLGRGVIAGLLRDGIREARDVLEWPRERIEALVPPSVAEVLVETVKSRLLPPPPEMRNRKQTKPGSRRKFTQDKTRICSEENRTGTSEPQAIETHAEEVSESREENYKLRDAPVGPSLVIDPDSPGIIEWCGQRVRLPGLPFRLLLTLASKPGRGITYRELIDRIWQGQAVVEQQQVNYHRGRIVKFLEPVMGRETARGLITTNSGQGMVLNLDADQVRILDGE
jgi:helicase